MSASSSKPDTKLHTAVLDWPEGSPSAFDIYSVDPSRFCAILEDPAGNGRDFLVSSEGDGRSLSTLEEGEAFLEAWRDALNFLSEPFPGVRQLFYAAYEAGGLIETLPAPKNDLPGPLLWVHEACGSVCIDQRERRLFVAASKKSELDALLTLTASVQPSQDECSPVGVTGLKESSASGYIDAVERVKRYITAGGIFQANIARFWQAELDTSELVRLYGCLRSVNPAPFSAMLRIGAADDPFYILSASPERLFSLSADGIVETRPIAGTRRRGEGEDDIALQSEMLLSEKERAEHIMLVDLERNDLGRVCESGSVEVNETMVVERYSTVQHIVSNVRGKLAKGRDVVDLFRAMFPGGTITGCPKVHCMEIIHELEPQPRGPYTGGIGYVGWDGSADMNILIRTFWHCRKTLHWAAGAGIVADSDAVAELEETGYKAKGLLRALTEPPSDEEKG